MSSDPHAAPGSARRHVGMKAISFRGVITADKIANYSRAIHARNPIHFDEGVARAEGHRGIVAPPGFITPFSLQDRAVKFDTFLIDERRALAGTWSWELHREVCAGDELHGRSELVEASTKTGAKSMDILVIETRFLNNKDELVCVLRDTTIEFTDLKEAKK